MRDKPMTFHLELFEVPEWLYKLIKFLKLCKIHAVPEISEKLLDDFIGDENYGAAKNYLSMIEEWYGSSTITIKYSTIISRMEILGK